MDERMVPVGAAETRPVPSPSSNAAVDGSPVSLDDPRALQILTTEHWSLLTARSLVYNESFTRTGMFLAFLSATLLVLGLISTASGFSDGFLVVAAIFLSLDLFIGLATLGRLMSAGAEDMRYLQGMNRLRHAYHEMVPGLDRYFISSRHDDPRSVGSYYAAGRQPGPVARIALGLTTTGAMISVICCAVAAGLAGVIVLLASHDGPLAALGGLIGFFVFFGGMFALTGRVYMRWVRSMPAIFPKHEDDAG